MASFEHSHGPESATETVRPSAPRPVQRLAGSQQRLLDLQRMAGNSAVSQMVQQDASVPVQRDEEEAEQENEEDLEG